MDYPKYTKISSIFPSFYQYWIQNIPSAELFGRGYRFLSFDVESLFSNVPLQTSINVILKRIYDDELINTDVKKNTMGRLMKILLLILTISFMNRWIFNFDNIVYEQMYG